MNAHQLRAALDELGYKFIAGAPSPYDIGPKPKRRQDFADLMRVLPTTVSRWLNGKLPVPTYVDIIIGLLRENQRLESALEKPGARNVPDEAQEHDHDDQHAYDDDHHARDSAERLSDRQLLNNPIK